MEPNQSDVVEPNQSDVEPDKRKRYYNSKKDDPEFRARNAARVREYRARKKEESVRLVQKADKKEKRREKKRKRLSACHATDSDAVSASEADNPNPQPPPINPSINPPIYNELFVIRNFIFRWTRDWGPVAFWPHKIHGLHEHAVHANSQGEWKCEMMDKASEGLLALAQLRGLFVQLPQDPWQVGDLWCQAFDLASEIQGGVACLHAHVAMYAN